MDCIRPTRLEIDLDCLAENIRLIRGSTRASAAICASMKANAYGHGAATVARTALECGADWLSVAILDEAIELRRSGIDAPVLILGSLERGRAGEVALHRLAQSISTLAEARELSEAALRAGAPVAIHIKVDTGMGRLGFVCGHPSFYSDILACAALPGIRAEGIFTHFATADEPDASFTNTQLGLFNAACSELGRRGAPMPIRHCSNSAAISGFPGAHMDMVRPGIALYGGAGEFAGSHHRNMPLQGVMSLKTRITLLKDVAPGVSVGYGRRFTAQRATKIAALPLGYGDGYSRGLSNGKGQVLIRGRRAPVAGIICMDQCMVDVTDVEGAAIGDEAVLFGKQGDAAITLEEIAGALGTIPYEIMCSISRRVPRVYIKNGKPSGFVNYLNGKKYTIM
ncbi:MAG: alanine racemase [Oscillospiraceae bacterium]|nr:alanine racemase [Oscillospiraceae bacterium]